MVLVHFRLHCIAGEDLPSSFPSNDTCEEPGQASCGGSPVLTDFLPWVCVQWLGPMTAPIGACERSFQRRSCYVLGDAPVRGPWRYLTGRVSSRQAVQEGFSEEAPSELHLSDMTSGRDEDLGAERSGKSGTTTAKALGRECPWPWDSRSTPGRSIVSGLAGQARSWRAWWAAVRHSDLKKIVF